MTYVNRSHISPGRSNLFLGPQSGHVAARLGFSPWLEQQPRLLRKPDTGEPVGAGMAGLFVEYLKKLKKIVDKVSANNCGLSHECRGCKANAWGCKALEPQ